MIHPRTADNGAESISATDSPASFAFRRSKRRPLLPGGGPVSAGRCLDTRWRRFAVAGLAAQLSSAQLRSVLRAGLPVNTSSRGGHLSHHRRHPCWLLAGKRWPPPEAAPWASSSGQRRRERVWARGLISRGCRCIPTDRKRRLLGRVVGNGQVPRRSLVTALKGKTWKTTAVHETGGEFPEATGTEMFPSFFPAPDPAGKSEICPEKRRQCGEVTFRGSVTRNRNI